MTSRSSTGGGLELPAAQRAIRDRCLHPTGQFVPFERAALEGTLADRFQQQAARHPNRLAVRTREHTLTYAALARAAGAVARKLRHRLGDDPGPVAVLLAPGAPAIAAMLGALQAGKLCVLVDPTHPPARRAHILRDSGAAVILTDPEHLELAGERGCAVIVVDGIEAEDGSPVSHGRTADSPACLLYTSGTTGPPKGVMHTSRSLLHFVMNYTNALHMCPDDRLVALRSMSVIGGVRDVLAAVLNGAAVYPLDVKREGVPAVAAWLQQHDITIAFFGSPLFRSFAETIRGPGNLPCLRVIRLGSDTVRPSDVELYRQRFARSCILVNGLGSAETGTLCKYFIDKDTTISHGTVPIGYPLPDMTTLVLGEDGTEVAPGEVGELAVRSRYLAAGYWNRPDLNAAAFRPDAAGEDVRVFRTGNLARRHDDGCLEHLGRRDFQVQVRGYRVELTEIEEALLGIAGIREALVLARQDGPGENRLVAYIVPGAGTAPAPGTVRRALAVTLPDHMIPAEIMALDAIPLNAHGKVDRAELPSPASTRANLDAEFVAPRTTMEEKLAAIWAEVLGLDRVGVLDPFLELGGDSLLAARIVARVLDGLNAEVPVRVLLESHTVAAMALAVVERPQGAADTLRAR